MGSNERTLGFHKYAFGSSRIASPAYQAWPTWGSDSESQLQMMKAELHAHSEFENKLR